MARERGLSAPGDSIDKGVPGRGGSRGEETVAGEGRALVRSIPARCGVGRYNHLVLARSQIQEVFPLAACSRLAENSRLGFATVASTSQWASGFSISSNTLGLSASLYDGRVRPRSTGKERDAESGNDYFGARYYASSMGRFMSPDWSAKEEPVPYAKLDDPQSLNLYAYVRNNPLSRVDADGHQQLNCSGANASGPGCQFWKNWNNTHGIIPDGTLKQLDQVAMKAEKNALGKTRADLKNGLHREWGGLILQNNETGAFSATSPITSNKEREVNVDKAAVPDGFSVVGDYHTHPHNTLTEGIGPSEGDISHLQGIARQTGVLRVGYVGETAGGYVSRYTAYEFNDHSSPPYGVVIGVVPPQ